MDELFKTLKTAREDLEIFRNLSNAMIEAVQNSPEYQALKTQRENAATIINNTESEIKALVLVGFGADGNKHPHPFVNVVVKTIVTIADPAKAKNWCETFLRDALKLDETKVKDYAKKIGDIPGVTISEEPQAQIASNLE